MLSRCFIVKMKVIKNSFASKNRKKSSYSVMIIPYIV